MSDFWREILFYLGIMATYVVTWSVLWGIVIFFGSRTH